MSQPRCLKCQTIIGPGLAYFSLPDGSVYHDTCFKCSICSEQLPDKFVKKDGQVMHQHCFIQHKAHACHLCHNPIGPSQRAIVLSSGLRAHDECFVCAKCGGKLPERFATKDDKYYHTECYGDLFAPKCSACSKSVVAGSPYFEFEKYRYHRDCFKCCECMVGLANMPFKPLGNGKFMCETCVRNETHRIESRTRQVLASEPAYLRETLSELAKKPSSTTPSTKTSRNSDDAVSQTHQTPSSSQSHAVRDPPRPKSPRKNHTSTSHPHHSEPVTSLPSSPQPNSTHYHKLTPPSLPILKHHAAPSSAPATITNIDTNTINTDMTTTSQSQAPHKKNEKPMIPMKPTSLRLSKKSPKPTVHSVLGRFEKTTIVSPPSSEPVPTQESGDGGSKLDEMVSDERHEKSHVSVPPPPPPPPPPHQMPLSSFSSSLSEPVSSTQQQTTDTQKQTHSNTNKMKRSLSEDLISAIHAKPTLRRVPDAIKFDASSPILQVGGSTKSLRNANGKRRGQGFENSEEEGGRDVRSALVSALNKMRSSIMDDDEEWE